VGSAGRSGMVTDDSETFRLYNLESEVDGGAFLFSIPNFSHRVTV
jgi:hypothetical protein